MRVPPPPRGVESLNVRVTGALPKMDNYLQYPKKCLVSVSTRRENIGPTDLEFKSVDREYVWVWLTGAHKIGFLATRLNRFFFLSKHPMN